MKKPRKVKFTLDDNESKRFNKENMVVVVRVRPLNNKEIEFSNIETIKVTNHDTITLLDPLEHKGQDESTKNRREQQYTFDHAFNKHSTQEEVYMNTSNKLLKGLLEGFNATILAYGASGAGKTYSMVGNGENPGVMVRSLSDLFGLIESEQEKNVKVNISYIEVYNETLRDLLVDGGSEVEMREDPNKGMTLVGLREVTVVNAGDVFKLLM